MVDLSDQVTNSKLRKALDNAVTAAVGEFLKAEILAQKEIRARVRSDRKRKVTRKLAGQSWSEDYTVTVDHKITRTGREAIIRVTGAGAVTIFITVGVCANETCQRWFTPKCAEHLYCNKLCKRAQKARRNRRRNRRSWR